MKILSDRRRSMVKPTGKFIDPNELPVFLLYLLSILLMFIFAFYSWKFIVEFIVIILDSLSL